MITVHHLENSRSQRVLWLLEELGLPYEVERYARDPQTMLAPPELKLVHPLGKSPAIDDDGRVLAETGNIITWLCQRYDPEHRLAPAFDDEARPAWTYWMHYAEGSAMPPLVMKLVFSVMPKRAPAWLRPLVKGVSRRAQSGFVDPQLKLHMNFWEESLRDSGWFAGPAFSAADVMMSFPMEAAQSRAGLEPGRPRCADWLKRCHARPAYQRALERGGPYAYA
ncbi:MAG: glutathione S-transferase [Caulobacteraceae bacterium]|nr:glutathione S-transferase [Caulobacter sp.]